MWKSHPLLHTELECEQPISKDKADAQRKLIPDSSKGMALSYTLQSYRA